MVYSYKILNDFLLYLCLNQFYNKSLLMVMKFKNVLFHITMNYEFKNVQNVIDFQNQM